jgi:hypothetical protein
VHASRRNSGFGIRGLGFKSWLLYLESVLDQVFHLWVLVPCMWTLFLLASQRGAEKKKMPSSTWKWMLSCKSNHNLYCCPLLTLPLGGAELFLGSPEKWHKNR